jgi:hypothetical protein
MRSAIETAAAGALCIAVALLSGCVAGEPATVLAPVNGWWENAPGPDDYAAVYPSAAMYQGVSGRVILNCLILPSRKLDCFVQSETPDTFGFGDAALTLSHDFVVRPVDQDKRLKIGSRIAVPVRFQAN